MRDKIHSSKFLANLTSALDSLSCTLGPAVFSQWSLALFFVQEAFFVAAGSLVKNAPAFECI